MIMMVYSQKWPTPNINTGSVKVTNYILYFSLLNSLRLAIQMSKKELFTLCLWKKWNMNGWVRKDNWVSTFLSVSQIHNNKIEYVQSVFDREKLKPPLESSILQAIFPSGLSYTHNHGFNTTRTYVSIMKTYSYPKIQCNIFGRIFFYI